MAKIRGYYDKMNRRATTRSSSRRMRSYGYSDERAQDINFEDITSCERNANILRMLRDGNSDWDKQLYIVNEENDEGNYDEFIVAEGDDLGWLGYFVGKCEVLDELIIWYLPEGRDKIAFIEGVSQNRSITCLEINCDIGDEGWSRLGCIFENNRNLSTLTSKDYEIGYEGALNLAHTLGEVKENPLKWFHITDADINDIELAVITEALRFLPELEYLDLHDNLIGTSGCVELGKALGRLPASNGIGCLDLNGNAINDEGLQALVAGVGNCSNLGSFYLERNYSITAAGLRSLSPLLQSETQSLICLCLDGINFGDEGMIALAEGLTGNKSLKQLTFDTDAASITSVGWSAFSRLLCDTSTINNTFLSNHTLELIGISDYDSDLPGIPEDVKRYLKWNKEPWRREVARCKILYSHPDLDTEPLLRWGLKFVPIVVRWYRNIMIFLDDARLSYIDSYRTPMIYIEAILRSEHSSDSCYESHMKIGKSLRSRQLSAMYKFIRDMPDLAVTGYWLRQVDNVQKKKRKLDDEQRRLDEQKQRLKDEEDAAWERLGGGALLANESNSRNKRIRHE